MGIVKITPSSEKMTCKAGERISFQFTLSNVSGGELKIGLDVRTDNEEATWFAIEGPIERELDEDVSTTIDINIMPPKGLLPEESEDKEYSFRLRVYDAQHTETVDDSPTVSVVVKPTKAEKKRCLWCWLVPVILLVTIVIGGLIWWKYYYNKVGDFVGENYEEIEDTLIESGYSPDVILVVEDKPAGTIIAQDPQPGEDIERNISDGSIDLNLRVSAVTISVPDFTGMSIIDAEALLIESGLVLGPVIKDNNLVNQDGLIVSQSPLPETRVIPASEITLTIPSALKTVPSVLGFSFDEAKAALEEVGFKAALNTVSTGRGQKGVIISQNPLAGSQKPINTQIVVNVESLQIKVPNVIGKSPVNATKILRQKGFKVKTRKLGTNLSRRNIRVTKQSPAKNKSVELGSVVTITYPNYGFANPRFEVNSGALRRNQVVGVMLHSVVAKGKATMRLKSHADLDNNNAPNNKKAQSDVLFAAKTSNQRYIKGINGAKIAGMGKKAPGESRCKNANMTGNEIDVTKLGVGSYLCVKTNKGQLSQVKVTSLNGTVPTQMGIEFTTWR